MIMNMETAAPNERGQLLLKTLVERYIADGQPVGSRALSKVSGLYLSPASIRNVMADLEDMGYIASPHTSAGRIPTARGYRFFVDSLLTVKPLDSVEIHQIEGHLQPENIQKLVTSASQMLSDITRFAGIVVTPRRSAGFRHIEFLELSEKRILLILVTSEGDVQNRIIQTDKHHTQSELIEAANILNQNYAGCSFEDIRSRVHAELQQVRESMTQLMSAALAVGDQAVSESTEDVVISGEINLLGVDDLASNMDKLRALFNLFERRTSLLQLLDTSSRAQGVQIFIGNEAGLSPLDECSVITAPYSVEGKIVGTVGVIGPTRMAYERVIPIVDITAKLLSSALAQC